MATQVLKKKLKLFFDDPRRVDELVDTFQKSKVPMPSTAWRHHIDLDIPTDVTILNVWNVVNSFLKPLDPHTWQVSGEGCPNHNDFVPTRLVGVNPPQAWACSRIACRQGIIWSIPLTSSCYYSSEELQNLVNPHLASNKPTPSLVDIAALQSKIRSLSEEVTALTLENGKLQADTKILELWGMSNIVTTADGFLRFLAGLNMQDHTIAEQKEFIERFHQVRRSLLALGKGSQ